MLLKFEPTIKDSLNLGKVEREQNVEMAVVPAQGQLWSAVAWGNIDLQPPLTHFKSH